MTILLRPEPCGGTRRPRRPRHTRPLANRSWYSGNVSAPKSVNPARSGRQLRSSAPPAGCSSMFPLAESGCTSLDTTAPSRMTPDLSRPDSIWMAVIGAQAPLSRSKEKVPERAPPAAARLPPLAMSCWIRAASAGSPMLSSRYMPTLISMSTSEGLRPASSKQCRAATSASRRAAGRRRPPFACAQTASMCVPIAVHQSVGREDGDANLDARGEREEHHAVALADPLLLEVLVQGEEERRRGRVAVLLEVQHHVLRRGAEPPGEFPGARADGACRRLMGNQVIDVIHRDPRLADRLGDQRRHVVDRDPVQLPRFRVHLRPWPQRTGEGEAQPAVLGEGREADDIDARAARRPLHDHRRARVAERQRRQLLAEQ